MDLADLIIVLILLLMFFRGSRIGFIREIFATSSFILSIFLGALLIPLIIRHISNPNSKSIWAIVLMAIFILTILTIGEFTGDLFRQKFVKKELVKTDRILGGALRLIGALIVIWLIAAIFIQFPNQNLKSQIQQSTIIGGLDKSLPNAPDLLSKIGNIIAPNGFPLAFIGNEPVVSKHIELNSSNSLNNSVNQNEASVVKIEGIGCGGIVEGSGFVAAHDLVITNAHVVAGIYAPYIYDQNGQRRAKVIYFDPGLDVAVLSASDLKGMPLTIDTEKVYGGTIGAIMGYPGGHSLQAKTAAIIEQIDATGKNIYGQGITKRNILVLEGNIEPGNSGGPFIGSSGQVEGLIFAKSTVYEDQGYAITMPEIEKALIKAESNPSKVSSGKCTE